MKELRLQYDLKVLCQVLEVSRSGYCRWTSRKPSKRAQDASRLEFAIQAVHTRTRGSYGPERLQKDCRTMATRLALGASNGCAASSIYVAYRSTSSGRRRIPITICW